MDRAYFVDLFEYTFWANRRVWGCAEGLDEEAYRQDLGYSVGSLHEQFVHTLMVEHWWLHYLATGEVRFLAWEDFPDRAAVRAQRDRTEAMIRAYLANLTPEELRREVRPAFWPEGRRPIAAYRALMQVANHSTDHRAQALAGVHRLGGATVGQDALEYFFARQAE